MNILIVDDLYIIRKFTAERIKEIFKSQDIYNFRIDMCKNESECIFMCAETCYNLIILDMMLPEDTGSNVACSIRKYGKSKKSIIVGYSMKGDNHEYVKNVLNQGNINFFIKKPLDPEQFKELISHEYFTSNYVKQI